MVVVGTLIAFLLKWVSPFGDADPPMIINIIVSILITFVIWEGNARIDCWLDRYVPWIGSPFRRTLVQGGLGLIYSASVIYIAMVGLQRFVCQLEDPRKGIILNVSIIVGTLASAIILSIHIGVRFYVNWRASILEVEKYKTESLQAQLANLKSQVNPHFLFNNLNVLSALVYVNQDKAVEFINQLANVYRYILDQTKIELVTLEKEIDFIGSYCFLLQIRFGDNLNVEITIADSAKGKYMLPMAMQVLIENAIQHNEITPNHPLHIRIDTDGERLTVSNVIARKKNGQRGSGTGLLNIQTRYGFFTKEPVIVNQGEDAFSVSLPLIHETV